MTTFKEFLKLQEEDKISTNVASAIGGLGKNIKVGAVPPNKAGLVLKTKLPKMDPKDTAQALQILTGNTPEV